MQALPAPQERLRKEGRPEPPQNQRKAAVPSNAVAETPAKDLPPWMRPSPSNNVPSIERPWEEIFESLRQSSRATQARSVLEQPLGPDAEEPMPRPAAKPPEPAMAPAVRHAIRPRASNGTLCFWERVFLNQPDLRMFK
jgi:hypothetical protein